MFALMIDERMERESYPCKQDSVSRVWSGVVERKFVRTGPRQSDSVSLVFVDTNF